MHSQVCDYVLDFVRHAINDVEVVFWISQELTTFVITMCSNFGRVQIFLSDGVCTLTVQHLCISQCLPMCSCFESESMLETICSLTKHVRQPKRWEFHCRLPLPSHLAGESHVQQSSRVSKTALCAGVSYIKTEFCCSSSIESLTNGARTTCAYGFDFLQQITAYLAISHRQLIGNSMSIIISIHNQLRLP